MNAPNANQDAMAGSLQGLVSWLCRKLRSIRGRPLDKFEAWRKKDDLLFAQFLAAYDSRDHHEMTRIRNIIAKAWQEYRDAS